MHTQDWYLAKCNITQYVLRNSHVFKGKIAANIASTIRLIVVCEQKPTQKIFSDILNAIQLSEEQVLHLTPKQLIISPNDISTVIWFIGNQPDLIWQTPLTIHTINLNELANLPQQKRQLWHQLCQYENYFRS